ncbi:MAG: ADP-ribosylglycohydrolase family protein [Phycisphaerae bacterium]
MKKTILLTMVLILILGICENTLASSTQKIFEPNTVTAGEFKLIYDPSAGEKEKWYINDHCFIRGTDGVWHMFGITKSEPAGPADEVKFAHATAKSLTQCPWKKEPFALTVDPNFREKHLWAPHVIFNDGLYYMYYCAGDDDHSKYKIHLATSKNLYDWQRFPDNPMVVDGYDARDPFIFRLKDKWVMYYTATSKPEGGNHNVCAVTSKDLIHWSDKKVVYTDPCSGTWGGNTESPQVIRRGKYYYLFIGPGDSYVTTTVYRSTDPFKWTYEQKVPIIRTHAAEVVRDVDGQWYISHCGWGQGGVYLAPLKWNDGVDDKDTSLPPPGTFRKISLKTYRDKMMAGWLGQMVGVTWGYPTEFKCLGKIVPDQNVPVWKPETINDAFWQDDLYVEMTFLKSIQDYGFDVSYNQAGIDFANTKFELWHANKEGRDNLRKGIAPPDSGHPNFNKHADDIDYQIEADFAGIISPGMPNFAIELGDKFGRIMNYGDGLYGGYFVSAMYSLAYFEKDINKIIEGALEYIPAESQYAQAINDTIQWHKKYPKDWQKTWSLINEKYQKNMNFRQFSCDKGDFNIDAKINGAYVVMGLLYGKGNIEDTIEIAMRCGQDSDCNPSNAAGILFTTIGYARLPEKYKTVKFDQKFDHTAYNLPSLFDLCQTLAEKAVCRSGGFVKKDMLLVPSCPAKPVKLEQSYSPGDIAESKYAKEQMKLMPAAAK